MQVERNIQEKCPHCSNTEVLTRITKYRRNYPFGKMSKARQIPLKVKYICKHIEKIKKQEKPCNFKITFDLRKQQDWIKK